MQFSAGYLVYKENEQQMFSTRFHFLYTYFTTHPVYYGLRREILSSPWTISNAILDRTPKAQNIEMHLGSITSKPRSVVNLYQKL